MDWIQALTNAGTGGILGIVGSVASGWLKIKGMKAQAEIEREMVKLQIDKGTIEADSADFQAENYLLKKSRNSFLARYGLVIFGFGQIFSGGITGQRMP